MRLLEFDPVAFQDYLEWVKVNPRTALRIGELIQVILKTPFDGIGKPEPLKHQLKGFWSRRITDEHRLVYKVTTTSIIILSCRTHYQ